MLYVFCSENVASPSVRLSFHPFGCLHQAEKNPYLLSVHNCTECLITLSSADRINWSFYFEYIAYFSFFHTNMSLSVGTECVGGLISKISSGAI